VDWSRLAAFRSLLLTLIGMASVVYGVFLFSVSIGFIVGGVALVLLAYLTDPTPPASR
jgi:membrane protein DedA with SNARE-associated domain